MVECFEKEITELIKDINNPKTREMLYFLIKRVHDKEKEESKAI